MYQWYLVSPGLSNNYSNCTSICGKYVLYLTLMHMVNFLSIVLQYKFDILHSSLQIGCKLYTYYMFIVYTIYTCWIIFSYKSSRQRSFIFLDRSFGVCTIIYLSLREWVQGTAIILWDTTGNQSGTLISFQFTCWVNLKYFEQELHTWSQIKLKVLHDIYLILIS